MYFLLNFCLFYSALMESLITPLQDKIEDWKKTANQLDKDHAKGTHISQVSYTFGFNTTTTTTANIFCIYIIDFLMPSYEIPIELMDWIHSHKPQMILKC